MAYLSLLTLFDGLLQVVSIHVCLKLGYSATQLSFTSSQLHHVRRLWVQALQHFHKDTQIFTPHLHRAMPRLQTIAVMMCWCCGWSYLLSAYM